MSSSNSTTDSRPMTWLITGCSSGFGLSLTCIALAAGHTVLATSRTPSRTPSLVTEIQSAGGKWLTLDVDDQNSGKIIDDLEASGTHIDVLVNNAGYSIFAPVEVAAEEDIRAQMESMYFGPLRLIKAVLPYMRQRKRGVVVNMSSGASLEGADSMGPYAGAKAGLDALTRVLAKEVAPFNIRTLTVVLGTFNTDLGAKAKYTSSLPEQYKGSVSEMLMGALSANKFVPNGDKDKAMKAVYEVVVGEGAGKGRETEKLLLLGSDMVARVEGTQKNLAHALEVFGDVARSVDADK